MATDNTRGRKGLPAGKVAPGRVKAGVWWVGKWAGRLGVAWLLLCGIGLLYLRILPPLTTGVQMQRRAEAALEGRKYQKNYDFKPLGEISDHLEHAVVAAEDGRFFEHYGFDLAELADALDQARRGGKLRGASTISQQLVKNLFMTTHRSSLRKILEIPLTVMTEGVLPKSRILELYLNVIEWGPGVFGAEAAARYHYKVSCAKLNRDQAARLAAIIPLPLKRKPGAMNKYSAEILVRMGQMGW